MNSGRGVRFWSLSTGVAAHGSARTNALARIEEVNNMVEAHRTSQAVPGP
jgi:hypothetical protein